MPKSTPTICHLKVILLYNLATFDITGPLKNVSPFLPKGPLCYIVRER